MVAKVGSRSRSNSSQEWDGSGDGGCSRNSGGYCCNSKPLVTVIDAVVAKEMTEVRVVTAFEGASVVGAGANL